MKFLALLFLISSVSVFAKDEKNVAKVTMLRGSAVVKDAAGNERSLKQDEWVSEGDVVGTKDKSFVKLTFTDKSTMNVGPASSITINKFGGGEAGLISVIQGQIRSQVTKDVLKQAQDKSKLIIKTKTAAMGIRGTDFFVAYSPITDKTNLITFEGNVALAQIEGNELAINNTTQLDSIISDPNRGVEVTGGLYAGTAPGQEHATIPTKISPVQFETLKVNENMETKAPTQSSGPGFHSIVPPGLSAQVTSNDNAQALDSQVKNSVGSVEIPKDVNLPPPEGFIDPATGAQAPAAGGFIDMQTGHYIAPPEGSKFDANAGVYIPPSTYGKVDESGNYAPPEGLKLNIEGNLVPVEPTSGSTGAQGEKGATGSATTATSTGKTGTVLAPAPIKPIMGAMSPGAPGAPKMEGPGMATGPKPPINDVLGGGFFIPGNYFIDNRDTSVLPNLNQMPTTTNTKFIISAP